MMVKILHIIKEKIMHYLLFASTFVCCFIAKSALAGPLLDTAEQLQWWTKDCPLKKDASCLTCPLFKALYDAASQVALASYNALHAPLVAVILVATGIWIAQKVIKDVASFETVEPLKMFQEIGYQLFRTMVVVLILNAHYFSVRALTLDPVLETGMKISQFFVGKSSANGFTCDTSKTGQVIKNGGLSAGVGDSMLCSVHGVESYAMDVIHLGSNSRCLAHDRSIGYAIDGVFIHFVIPNANYLITGFLLMLIGAIYLIGCPFLLLDSVINMCFAAALLPVGVACYAFKITASHLRTIWNTFMEGVFHFLFMTLILYVMGSGISNILADVKASVSQVEAGAKTLGNIVHGLSFVGVNFLKLGFIFFLGWSVLEKAAELARTFAPGGMSPGKGMGSDMGKQAATAARRFAGGALSATGTALKAGARATGLDAKAQELRAKAAKAIRNTASAPFRGMKALHNSESARAMRKKAGAGLQKFGQNAKAAIATSSVGMAAYAIANSDAVKATKMIANISYTTTANFLNNAKRVAGDTARNAAAATIRMHRRNAERVNKGINGVRAVADHMKDKASLLEQRLARKTKRMAGDAAIAFLASRTGQAFFKMHDSAAMTHARRVTAVKAGRLAQFANKAHRWNMKALSATYDFAKDMTVDKALDMVGQGIGYVGGAASVLGAGAVMANPGVQAAALSVLGAYGAGKALSPAVRHAHVGIEFVKSATRVGLRNLDARMANGLRNLDLPKELRQGFNRDGMLLSEQIRKDMMAHNHFDEKNQAIAEKYLGQQLERDKRSSAGQAVLGERRQAHWENMQNLHAQFEQKKAEMAERQRQQHWNKAQEYRAQREQKMAEATARKKAQDDAVAAALEKKQHWMNADQAHAKFEQRKAAMQSRHKVYGDIDKIMDDQNISDGDKEIYFAAAMGEEKRINDELRNSQKPQSERDLEGLMATGLKRDKDRDKDEEFMALDMAIEKEKEEIAQRTASLTKEEEDAIRAQAGAKFDQDLAQMKETQAAEEAAARAAEEARLAKEAAEKAAAEAKAKADMEEAAAKAAEEQRAAEEWKRYEKAMKEWRKIHEQRTMMEKLLGIELSEKEVLQREKKKAMLAQMQAAWEQHEKEVEAEQQRSTQDIAATNSASNNNNA